MKIKNIILAGSAILCSLFSCDVLDTTDFTVYDDDIVWGSKSTADAFVTGRINEIVGYYINGPQTTWEERTNNAVHANGGEVINFVRENIDRYFNKEELLHKNKFKTIRGCNLIIEKAMEYDGNGLTENESRELIAKGKTLRAMAYYIQAREIGRFVWVDRVLAPSDTISNGLMLPTTANTTESYTHILNDLTDNVIADLPVTGKSGELTQSVAYAMRSEIALQAAAYETNAEKKKEWLKLVIASADKITDASLADDYGAIFNEKDRYSNEIIFGVYKDKANTNTDHIAPLQNVMPNVENDVLVKNGCGPLFKTNGGQPFIGWLWWSPTQNLVDEYDVIDEETGKAVKWDETSQFKKNVQVKQGAPNWVTDGEVGDPIFYGDVKGDLSISELMYNNRDARFYDNFVYDGTTWWTEDIRLTVNGNLWRKCRGALGAHMGLTNYYWRKGVYNVEPRVLAGTPTDYHFVLMRYGRVLLNKAEAILWLAGMGEMDFSGAVNICNETRTIHGKLPAVTVANLEEAWKLYKKERRCELPMENDYYWSLLRWGKHGGFANEGKEPGGKIVEFTVSPTYIEITHDRKSFYVGKTTHAGNDVREFREDRRYLLPIPQGQIDRNPNLGPNNPGW